MPGPQRYETRDVDVLILGAGLAGMRAALSALQAPAAPARVLVATLLPGPSGSSFANVHDELGIQAPDSDARRERFARTVLDLARPGRAAPVLVRALAEDAEPRWADLLALGPRLRLQDGRPLRRPGCFDTEPMAYIFEDLAGLHRAFAHRVRALGGEFLPGCDVRAVLTGDNAAAGALLLHDGRPLAVRAAAVVAALGGPAPLFARHMAGPGTPGASYGLLARAGCRLDNASFLQFMWAELPDQRFRSPAALLAPGCRLLTPDRRVLTVPDDLPAPLAAALPDLRRIRTGHAPMSHGRPDAALDHFLLALRHPDGLVRWRPAAPAAAPDTPSSPWSLLAPQAHAGNGGAIIDEHAETTVANLFAAGECATGMHGANRLGGAMVLATQVFGHRAGLAAARRAQNAPAPDAAPLPLPNLPPDLAAPQLDTLRQALQAHAIPGPDADPDTLSDTLDTLPDTPQTATARAIAAHLGEWGWRSRGKGETPS